MNRKRMAAAGLIVGILVAAGSFVVWRAANAGCSADRLPENIGVYHRTGNELTTIDPMPVASGVQMAPPQLVLELAGDGACPAPLSGGPMGIWLKVSPTRYVLYSRPGGP